MQPCPLSRAPGLFSPQLSLATLYGALLRSWTRPLVGGRARGNLSGETAPLFGTPPVIILNTTTHVYV